MSWFPLPPDYQPSFLFDCTCPGACFIHPVTTTTTGTTLAELCSSLARPLDQVVAELAEVNERRDRLIAELKECLK